MPELRSGFPDSLEVDLMAYFEDELPRHPSLVDKIFNVKDSTKQKEELSGVTGISKLTDVGENGLYQYEDELEDFKTTLTHKTFKRGIQVSLEQLDDDQHRNQEGRIRALAKAAARTDDFNAFSVLRNAFTSTATSYGSL